MQNWSRLAVPEPADDWPEGLKTAVQELEKQRQKLLGVRSEADKLAEAIEEERERTPDVWSIDRTQWLRKRINALEAEHEWRTRLEVIYAAIDELERRRDLELRNQLTAMQEKWRKRMRWPDNVNLPSLALPLSVPGYAALQAELANRVHVPRDAGVEEVSREIKQAEQLLRRVETELKRRREARDEAGRKHAERVAAEQQRIDEATERQERVVALLR